MRATLKPEMICYSVAGAEYPQRIPWRFLSVEVGRRRLTASGSKQTQEKTEKYRVYGQFRFRWPKIKLVLPSDTKTGCDDTKNNVFLGHRQARDPSSTVI